MSSYKQILVAIDLSDEADDVLQAAADIAAENKAVISIIHVADLPLAPYSGWSDYVAPYNEQEVRQMLFKDLAQRVEDGGLSRSLITIDFGRPVDVIIKKAEEERADLIVIGSHGRHGVKILLGSTANGVLHRANCDVLAVRVREVINQ